QEPLVIAPEVVDDAPILSDDEALGVEGDNAGALDDSDLPLEGEVPSLDVAFAGHESSEDEAERAGSDSSIDEPAIDEALLLDEAPEAPAMQSEIVETADEIGADVADQIGEEIALAGDD